MSDEIPAHWQPLPPRPTGRCFGCGPENRAGLRMEFYTDGKTVFSRLAVEPHLCGWGNVVHGGIISTMLDEIMGWTAIVSFRRLVLTKTLSVEFLKPLFASELLEIRGQVTSSRSEREALLEGGIRNPAGELCAIGRATFALLTPEAARDLGFLDPGVIADFTAQFRAQSPKE